MLNSCTCLEGGWTEGRELYCIAGYYACNRGCCKVGNVTAPAAPIAGKEMC